MIDVFPSSRRRRRRISSSSSEEGMAFDPTTEEWIALLAFLVSGAIVWASFVLSASAFHWREWYSEARQYRPWFLWGELLGFLYCVAWILIPIGGWLGWREGFRSDSLLLVPSSGNVPSDSDFFWFNLFYIVFWGLSLFGGPAFFTVGLQMKWPGISLLVSLGIVVLAGFTTVWGFFLWWVVGVLILIGAVVIFYGFVICAAIYWNLQNGEGTEKYHDPVKLMHVWHMQQHSQQASQFGIYGMPSAAPHGQFSTMMGPPMGPQGFSPTYG